MQEKDNLITVGVLRRKFERNAIQQLLNAADDDWEKQIKVIFIGKDGDDAGKLSREFFTLYFERTKVLTTMDFSC